MQISPNFGSDVAMMNLEAIFLRVGDYDSRSVPLMGFQGNVLMGSIAYQPG